VAEDPVRETVSPGAHEHRADHDQREVGKDRKAERDRHVQLHAELATDLDLAQRPGDEGSERADRDQLPQAAFHQRRKAQAV